MEQSELARRYDMRVPRYTSYPTALQFHAVDGDGGYRNRLASLDPAEPLSLYLHVPFCTAMCWYCGCHTRVVRSAEPIAAYADLLLREIDLVADALGVARAVRHIHWGGGSPTILSPSSFRAVMERIRRRFDLRDVDEIAVEVDPRRLSTDLATAMRDAGVNRASLGVQTFDLAVQRLVNRVQPFEVVADAVSDLRRVGVSELNFDLMYGLPGQTQASIQETVARALELDPARLALFGYAHVPWMKRHQRLIHAADLPDATERLAQSEGASAELVAAGFRAIGLDHFAAPGDSLAKVADTGRLHRNFQGYTTDAARTLIGFGASSIGRFSDGYVQNAVALIDYGKALTAGRFPIAKSLSLTADDRLRWAVIERLMCDLTVDLNAAAAGDSARLAELANDLWRLEAMSRDGLVEIEGNRVTVTERGRPFVRVAAAAFDRYLQRDSTRHTVAV